MREILEKIKKKKINISVIGLGYVGLPLTIELVKKNYLVTGIDIDFKKVKIIKSGRSPIKNISENDISILSRKNFE